MNHSQQLGMPLVMQPDHPRKARPLKEEDGDERASGGGDLGYLLQEGKMAHGFHD